MTQESERCQPLQGSSFSKRPGRSINCRLHCFKYLINGTPETARKRNRLIDKAPIFTGLFFKFDSQEFFSSKFYDLKIFNFMVSKKLITKPTP